MRLAAKPSYRRPPLSSNVRHHDSPKMNLHEVIAKLNEFPDETFICARKPWTQDSEVRLIPFPEDLRIPESVRAEGFEYFLEVSTAVEILDGFLARNPTPQQVTAFVIYYAENDAFPEWSASI